MRSHRPRAQPRRWAGWMPCGSSSAMPHRRRRARAVPAALRPAAWLRRAGSCAAVSNTCRPRPSCLPPRSGSAPSPADTARDTTTMCQLFALNSNAPSAVTFSFTGFSARGGQTGEHADGWGMAFHGEGGCRVFLDDPCTLR
eukprot:Opistho-2@26209